MAEILSLSEAIARIVRAGDSVALEGFTHLIPFAAGHEIIRQELVDLTLIRMTPDLLYDQMIGCGCARKLVFSLQTNAPPRTREEEARKAKERNLRRFG